jgi:predicted Ser/Thr protein kinase
MQTAVLGTRSPFGYTSRVSVLVPGTLLGECRIEAVVGRGGMGVVYRARQLDLDRDVAVKVIAPSFIDDPESRKRFLMEARAAAAVEHPNVVPVHRVGVADGQAYLVMRYVPGDSLQTVVRRAEALSPSDAAGIAEQLGQALDAIHRAGYVHRDVKPQNVLIDEDEHAYLSDFGLAKGALATAGLTQSDQWVGTPDYVAPEQIRGEQVDARTDVYSLGGVLYFMLTGHVPFERASGQAKLWAQLSADVPLPSARRPELSPACDAVVQRALAKEPAQRYPSAGDLGRAARDAAGGVSRRRSERMVARGAAAPAREPASTTAVAPSTVSPRRRSVRAVRGRTAYGAAAAALAVIAAINFLPRDGPRERLADSATPIPSESPAEQTGDRPRRGPTIRGVTKRPRGIAVAAGDLWVISHHRSRVTRLDRVSRIRHGDQPVVGRGASDIAVHEKLIWVAVPRRGEVVLVDARSGHVEARIEPPVEPFRVAVGRSGLWVAGHGATEDDPDVLLHYDRAGAQVLHRVEVRNRISAITLGDGAVWMALESEPRIVRLSLTAERQWGATLTGPASALVFGGGYLWATVPEDEGVARVDPGTGQTVTTNGAREPGQVAFARGRVYVADTIDHSLLILDPKHPRDEPESLRMPLNPYAVTPGAGHIWVSGLAHNTLTRLDL